MRYHSSCTSGKAAIARGDELAMQARPRLEQRPRGCCARKALCRDGGVAQCPLAFPLLLQANRFYPTDPFTSSDDNPNYDSRDPTTGKPSVEIEIIMSRK